MNEYHGCALECITQRFSTLIPQTGCLPLLRGSVSCCASLVGLLTASPVFNVRIAPPTTLDVWNCQTHCVDSGFSYDKLKNNIILTLRGNAYPIGDISIALE